MEKIECIVNKCLLDVHPFNAPLLLHAHNDDSCVMNTHIYSVVASLDHIFCIFIVYYSIMENIGK